jgi:hypothetical protein
MVDLVHGATLKQETQTSGEVDGLAKHFDVAARNTIESAHAVDRCAGLALASRERQLQS